MSAMFKARAVRFYAIALASCLSISAFAQSAGTAGSPSQTAQHGAAADIATSGLEEVTVTARRREENVQDTPVSISVLTASALKAARIEDLSRVANFAPGVSIAPTSTDAGLGVSIRGITTFDPILTNEPAVGVYLDGVYVNAVSFGQFDLLDLERIEVLRGPQGTVFGRNTTGGALNITTRRPDAEFGVDATLSYARFNNTIGRLSVNTGELAPGWRASLSYQHRRQNGFVDSISAPDSRDPGATEADAFRFALDGAAGPLSIQYTFDLLRKRDVLAASQWVLLNPTYGNFVAQSAGLGGDTLRVSPDRLATVNEPNLPRVNERANNHTLVLTLPVTSSISLKSISGYRVWKDTEPTSYGSSAGLLLPITNPRTGAATEQSVNPFIAMDNKHVRQFSEEFQILGTLQRVNFIAGGFFFHSTYGDDNPQQFLYVGAFPGLGVAGLISSSRLRYEGRTRSYAGYGSVNYTPPVLSERMEISAGVRYTEDQKGLDIELFPGGAPPALSTSHEATSNNTSYNVSLNYHFTPDVMAYGRVGTGYQAGGANPRSFNAPTYGPETATVYEVGLKSQWWKRRLRGNLSLYHTNYDDLQVSQLGYDSVAGVITQTVNAGKAEFDGFEADLAAIPLDGLTFTLGLAYVDPRYVHYIVNGVDLKNEAKFPFVSSWTGNFGISYVFARTPAGILTANTNYSFKSSTVFEALNSSDTVLPNGRDLLGAGNQHDLSGAITLANIPLHRDATAEISVFGRNLLDKRYRYYSVDFGQLGFGTANFVERRVIGVEGRVHF